MAEDTAGKGKQKRAHNVSESCGLMDPSQLAQALHLGGASQDAHML